MKNCELCKFPARTHCESDEAFLCWDCDAKVHGANFLVARHLRGLLCQSCQCLTPWKAAGAKLGRTLSVCDRCLKNGGLLREGVGESELDLDDLSATSEEEGDADNQVVPWSSPPPAASSSSSSCTGSQESPSEVVIESVSVKSQKRTRDSCEDLNSMDQNFINGAYSERGLIAQAGDGYRNGGDVKAISIDGGCTGKTMVPPTDLDSRSAAAAVTKFPKRFHQLGEGRLYGKSGASSSMKPSRTI